MKKATTRKLTVSEQQQIKVFMSKDIRVKALLKNYRARGFLNVLEEIMLRQIYGEYKSELIKA